MRTARPFLGGLCVLLACSGSATVGAVGMTCDPIRPYRTSAPDWIQARRAALGRDRLQRPAPPTRPDWISQRRAAYASGARPGGPGWLESRRARFAGPARFGWVSRSLQAHVSPEGGVVERRIDAGPPGANSGDPSTRTFSFRERRPLHPQYFFSYRRGPGWQAPPPPPFFPDRGHYGGPWTWAPSAPAQPPATPPADAPTPRLGDRSATATRLDASPSAEFAPSSLTADSDADGVPDLSDRCVATPGGLAVDVFGCPPQGTVAGHGGSAEEPAGRSPLQ
jgi:hypothetical protein